METILKSLFKPICFTVIGWIAFALPIPIVSSILGCVFVILGLVFLFGSDSDIVKLWLKLVLLVVVIFVTPAIYFTSLSLYFTGFLDNKKNITSDVLYEDSPVVRNSMGLPSASSVYPIPGDQMGVRREVERAREESSTSVNEIGRKQAQIRRERELCSILGDGRFSGWRGKVVTIGATGDGHAYVTIESLGNFVLKTSNNAFSDSGMKTLIPESSPLYSVLSSLQEGELVEFSGRFVKGHKSCVYEASLTLDGSLSRPDFMVVFSSIRPYSR